MKEIENALEIKDGISEVTMDGQEEGEMESNLEGTVNVLEIK